MKRLFNDSAAMAAALLSIVSGLNASAVADEPAAWDLTPAEMATSAGKTAHVGDPGDGTQALLLDGPMQLEKYSLQSHLSEGWWRISFRLQPDRAARPDERLECAVWNPNGSPGAFRFVSALTPPEFGPGGKPVVVTRQLRVGPANGNLGMYLRGGWKGLAVAGLRFEPIADPLFLESVRADRLLYGSAEGGTAIVSLLNGGTQPSRARLIVELEAGLGTAITLHDAEVEIPPTGRGAHVVTVPFPPQAEYGHQLRALLRPSTGSGQAASAGSGQARSTGSGQAGEVLGDARDWFYVSDRPVRIGHLAAWGADRDYEPKAIDTYISSLRHNLFPLTEMAFWAPDDYCMLVPPEGKERWWSGQTLAQLSTATVKARIDALHAQGMRAIAYTDLRLDFGFRVSELFRRHPDWCNWDANDTTMAWSPAEVALQWREDDAERFDPKEPNKPRFGARGVWGPQTGNPAPVDYHIAQLVASAKFFGWDGFRYDDPYDYDFAGADLLGRKVPFAGFSAPVLLARLRSALEQAKPGIVYGHNMEWSRGLTANVEVPMPLDTPPAADDYYTEHLRDDGLHLQERTTTYWGDGSNWEDMAEKLNRLGHNAARHGGHAYAITKAHSFAIDGRTLTALMLASRVHLAYWASEWQVPYMRLAARHCDLLYGDSLRPAPEGTLTVRATGGREVWWQRYVRVLEPAAGKRVYLVHLINPPVKPGIDGKNQAAPPAAAGLELAWRLPARWKAERAWELSADRGDGLDLSGAPGSAPTRRELPVSTGGGVLTVKPSEVIQWTIVAVECTGPARDRLPAWRFTLPPPPAQPAQFPTAPVPAGYTPNATPPRVFDADHPMWKAQPRRTNDSACVAGKAVQLDTPLSTETYFSGVQGGRYRFALRVKSSDAPPANAKLHLSCWPNGRAWVVNADFPLADLKPGQWTNLVIEADLGSDRGNCGVQVTGGWSSLLVDRLEFSLVKGLSESGRLAEQKLRPWPADLAPAAAGGAWCQRGLWHEFLRLDDAFKACGVSEAPCDWYIWRAQRGWNGPQLAKPEDLAQYRLVVLADVDLRTLPVEQRAWLRGWVEAGGSLLMTGGPYGLGRGWWQESDLLAPILPATLSSFDLRAADAPLRLATAGPLAAVKLPGDAVTCWLHELAPKPGSTVALTAGGKPALVLGEAGKGRVALLALAPLGEDCPGAWWRSDAGGKIVEATCRWLLRQPVVTQP